MTAQASDGLLYNGDKHQLIGVAGTGLFDPQSYGFQPLGLNSGNRRGSCVTYVVKETELILQDLNIRDANDNYPKIAGVEVSQPNSKRGLAKYNNLMIPIPFTGKLRAARGFHREYYVHYGFQAPSAFDTVLDLTFNQGKLVELKDRSDEVAEMRGKFHEAFGNGDIRAQIDEAYSLSMELK